MEKIGIGLAIAAKNLGLIVHASGLGPALLGQPHGASLEVEDEHRLVVAVGLIAVNISMHLRISPRDPRLPAPLAENPAEELDGVATHVHGHAAAAAPGIVEPTRVRSVVLFGLLDE